MFELDLQFFGGRGASSSRGGRTGGRNLNVTRTTSLVSMRESNPQEVDEVLGTLKGMQGMYGEIVPNDLQVATIRGGRAMAYYDSDDNIAVNSKYFNSDAMNRAYASSVSSGFHPSSGNKTGMEAVVAHEVGHKLTYEAGRKMGYNGWGSLDTMAGKIMDEASRRSRTSVDSLMKSISGYAQTNPAEAIAEAVSDVYCNGRRASGSSRTVVGVLNKYLK